MERTPQQVEADKVLSEAIEGVLRAYGMLSDMEVVSDHVTCFATMAIENGEERNYFGSVLRNGNVPTWRVIGLLSSSLTRYQADCLGMSES